MLSSCTFRRCSTGLPPSLVCAHVGQGLFDRFWQDMDHNLREMGTGDLAVPKRMKALGEAYYGRAGAYRAAFADPDRDALVEALKRNVYARRWRSVRPSGSPPICGPWWARSTDQDAATLAGGTLRFPDPHAIPAPDEVRG